MEISPTVPQDAFIFAECPYPAIVAGFGAGKTEALINRAIIGKIQHPRNDRAFYEPTYDLIRTIAWPRFEEALTNLKVPYRLTKHPINTLELEGYGKIIFRSMDTPSRIIGYEVGDSDVDELDTLKRDNAAEVWRRILSRNRQKKASGLNTAAVATTPEGFRFVYETWEVRRPPGYEMIRAPSYSNPHLPESYIDDLRNIYPPQLLDAYIEGLFVNLTSGSVYTAFDRTKNSTDITSDGREPLFVGMDFNVGNMSCVIHVKRNGKPVAVDEMTKGYDTPDMARSLQDRYPRQQICVYPDSSGASRKSVNASTTDIQILKDHGFSVFAPKKNPPVRDRVNAMNAAFSNGYLVNIDRCPSYARCLEQQPYDNKGEPDKSGGLDHLNDASGYFIHHDYPIVKPVYSLNLGSSF